MVRASSDRTSEMKKILAQKAKKIFLFGHFGQGNFGNESTLMSMLLGLRRLAPDAQLVCVCTGPETVAKTYNIETVASRERIFAALMFRNPLAKAVQKILIGIPCELYRWMVSVRTLWGADALIMPGTGVLTDAYTLFDWGPYDMFRWSVAAKLCGCKLLFVSVGAGPLYSRKAKLFIKVALRLADFRSFRDESSVQYLKRIGFRADNDPVCPDLAFGLTDIDIAHHKTRQGRRPVVGLGLMEYAGKYSVEKPSNAVHTGYLDQLTIFVSWLLRNGYDVRLLIGDLADVSVTKQFRTLLKQRAVTQEGARIIDEPIDSVEDLLVQLAACDYVVATRFHNVLLAIVLGKPVVAISFHHKCISLMKQMGLQQYLQDMDTLQAHKLIQLFCEMVNNAEQIKRTLQEKSELYRKMVDEQHDIITSTIWKSHFVLLPA